MSTTVFVSISTVMAKTISWSIPAAARVPSVYLNTGSGYAAATSPFPTQQFAGRFVFGDFNNDGFIDVLNQTGNISGTGITLYLNNANGTLGFTAIAQPTSSAFTTGPLTGLAFTQVTSSSVYAVDLNGDGKVDILDAQSSNTTPATPRLFQNTGSGFSSVADPFAGQPFTGHFVFGDFNSDGYVDVLNQNSDSNGTASGGLNVLGGGITLYLNNHNGTFTFTTIAKPDDSTPGAGDHPFTSGPLTGIDFTNVAVANLQVFDWDHDGDVDIVDSQSGASRYLVPGQRQRWQRLAARHRLDHARR